MQFVAFSELSFCFHQTHFYLLFTILSLDFLLALTLPNLTVGSLSRNLAETVFFTPLPSLSLTCGTQPGRSTPAQTQWHVSKSSANIYPRFLISWFPSYPYPNKKGLENERPGIMCMWSLPTTGSPLSKNYNTGSGGQPQFTCTHFPKLANFQKGSKSKSLKYVRKMKWKAMDSTQKKRERDKEIVNFKLCDIKFLSH